MNELNEKRFEVSVFNKEEERLGNIVSGKISLPTSQEEIENFLIDIVGLEEIMEESYDDYVVRDINAQIPLPFHKLEDMDCKVDLFDLNDLAREINNMTDEDIKKLGAIVEVGFSTMEDIITGYYEFDRYTFVEIPMLSKSDDYELLGRVVAKRENVDVANFEEFGRKCELDGWAISSLGYALIDNK